MKLFQSRILLLAHVFSVSLIFADAANVACKDSFGNVNVRRGQCYIGEEFVQVMDSAAPGNGGSRARIACKDSFGNVNVRNGQCYIGEVMVKVMD